MEESFNISEACKAQAELCKEKEYPYFAPNDGVCWSCNRNIYTNGVTVESAGKSLVTGCPHCHRSYCD